MRFSMVAVLSLLALCSACNPGPSTAASSGRTSGSPQASQSSQCPTGNGSIQGSVAYPGDVQEALAVYAVATDGRCSTYVEMADYGRPRSSDDAMLAHAFKLVGVAPGDYFVLTAVRDLLDPRVTTHSAARHFDAGYTKAVQCGLGVGCTDHTLVHVHVGDGPVTGIDPGDWYAGPDSYPLIPGGGPPVLRLDPVPQPEYFAQLHTSARLIASNGPCDLNRSCLQFLIGQQGHAAWYYVYEVGTNGIVMNCTVYMTYDESGFQYFDSICRHVPQPVVRLTDASFPAPGSSGQIVIGFGQTGCVNVHTEPGLTAKVATCLPDGTKVKIDGGPYYLPESTSSTEFGVNYWWNVAGKGWVVHRYLMYSP